MRIRRCWFGVIALCAMVGLSGCMTKRESVAPTYDSYPGTRAYGGDYSEVAGSLFPSDQAVLSNEDIQRILSAQITLPGRARLAVMDLGGGRYYRRSILGHETTEDFLAALRQSSHIASAAALPRILVPERRSVPYLREAAARYQADLLLIYWVDSGNYARYRVAHSDEVKTYCTVEAALIDVRSGTVPFTTTGYEEVRAEKSKEDLSFSETTDKAYGEAETRALRQVAGSIIQYLDDLDTSATFSE